MIEPTGYTALDLIGFTDRGAYDPTANYVKNDIVSVGNTKWRCLIDDTHNVTPTEGANWTIYLESATSLAGMDDVNITTPTDGDLLQYNSTNNKWMNSSALKDEVKTRQKYNTKNLLGFFGTITGRTISTSDNDLLGKISLKQGDKIVYTCNQDSALTSNTRNTLVIVTPSGTKIYEDGGTSANYHNAAGLHIIRYTATENGVYTFQIWTHTLSSAITYSQFMVCSDYDYGVDSSYIDYAPTNRDLAYVRDGWKKNGAYNLLPKELYASTQVSHGITWTVRSDGSVGTSNTSKDNTNESFVLLSRTSGYTVPAGQYCFCGKPSASKYRMMLQCTRGGVLTVLADLDNNTTRAIVTIQEGDALQVALTVKSGETGGDTFYPMLTTDLSATNADFTTPAMTNRELTEKNEEAEKHTISVGTRVALTTSDYSASADGYVSIYAPYTNDYCRIDINGILMMRAIGSEAQSLFVRKGTNIKVNAKSNDSTAYFYPLG